MPWKGSNDGFEREEVMNYLHSYASIDDFYTARGGSRSGESDYGGYNIDDLRAFNERPLRGSYGNIRVSHVHNTGDFYALEYSTGRVILLGSVGDNIDEPTVYNHFGDWADGEGQGRPLSWFKERLALRIKKGG